MFLPTLQDLVCLAVVKLLVSYLFDILPYLSCVLIMRGSLINFLSQKGSLDPKSLRTPVLKNLTHHG